MSKLQFGRLITAMVTPFDKDGNLDISRTEELAARLAANGTDSIVVCATTGESPTLSHSQKIDVIKAAVRSVGEQIPVIANVGNNSTADSIALAQEVEKLGIDGFMCVVPYYNKPPQEGLYQHFKAIANSTDLPVILYNIPCRCVVNFTDPQASLGGLGQNPILRFDLETSLGGMTMS